MAAWDTMSDNALFTLVMRKSFLPHALPALPVGAGHEIRAQFKQATIAPGQQVYALLIIEVV